MMLKMNTNQLIAMWIGIAIIVLLGLFPPFHIPGEPERIYVGCHYYTTWLANAKIQGDKEFAEFPAKIDFQRLFLKWFLVLIVTTGAIVSLRKSKNLEKSSSSESNQDTTEI